MKKIMFVMVLSFLMMFGVIYASNEKIILKNAPDYEVFYNNGKVAVLSHIKTDKSISEDILKNNGLLSKYQVYLPIYIQIDDSKPIGRVNLVKNGLNISTEKELKFTAFDGGYEVSIDQVVGIPDGVGMTAETIYQTHKIYKYQIDWTYREFVQNSTNLDVVVIRESDANDYDYIYKNMVNKNFDNIYSEIMTMPGNKLSVLETYIAAKYGVIWDVDAKIIEEMRELNTEKINFTDINSSYWAYNVIKSMAIKGILVGYEDNTFRPEENLSRAEAAQILVNYFNLTDKNSKTISDLSEDFWACEAIKKASIYMPMNGNIFDSEKSITRKDFIISIMNIKKEKSQPNVDNAFSDLNNMSDDEREKINLAHFLNIIDGYEDGTFRPNDFITRAEACTILARAK